MSLSFYQTNLQSSPQSRYMFDIINRCSKIYSRRSKGPVENCTENCDWFAQRTIFISRLCQSQTVDGPTVTSWSFFSKGHLFLIFVVLPNQNNPLIPKYDSYDRSRLLQPCGKFFSWAPPIPLGNFYPLAPPPLRNFHWPSVGGGGVWIFSGITQCRS